MKEQNRRQALELMEQEAAHRMAVLERLAQQVPYYERLLEAKADLSKMTAAVEAAAYQKPEAQTRGHLPLHGFDNAQVPTAMSKATRRSFANFTLTRCTWSHLLSPIISGHARFKISAGTRVA